MRHKRFRLGAVVVSMSMLMLGIALPSAHAAPTRLRPVIFVHGFSGSGAQFETQALRFTSNGYPAQDISVLEYDSTFSTETQDQVFTSLDRRIRQLLKATGADQVDLLGHSLGTMLMQAYLNSDPKRAAKVAHYVNLDGMTAASPPGGVPTLAIWANGDPTRKIVGAANVYFTNQTHVQVVTSPETFTQIYTFFNGRAPATTDVVPQRGPLQLSGRAIIFPQNTGAGGKLQIFEVSGTTGARLRTKPDATFAVNGDGSWGPFTARPGSHYEFAIVRAGAPTEHLYYEPFLRNDSWIRLLASPPTGGIGGLVERNDHTAALTIIRYKEWWGDQGTNNDELDINGVSVLNAANSPRAKLVNGIFVYDAGLDGVTNLATPIPVFFQLPFLTGIDDVLPATSPPDDTISISSIPRGGDGHIEVINVPNWASSTDVVSVQFRDFIQD